MQYLLPHRALSWAARQLAYSRWRPWKNWLIRLAVSHFRIDLDEAADPNPENYASFNAFFTRALKAGARVADPEPSILLQPADGIDADAEESARDMHRFAQRAGKRHVHAVVIARRKIDGGERATDECLRRFFVAE
jgi:hypothetical protein